METRYIGIIGAYRDIEHAVWCYRFGSVLAGLGGIP
jgi:predicted component of type VI protein secretion system